MGYCIQLRPHVGKDITFQVLSYCLKEVAATGTVKANQSENAPLQDLGKMIKEIRGTSDVVTDISSCITAVRLKDNKVVNALSKFTGNEPIKSVKRFFKKQNKRVDIEQPNIIDIYNKSMGGVDRTY